MAELGNHNTVFTSDDANAQSDIYVMGPFGAGVSGTITATHFYQKPVAGSSGTTMRFIIYGASGSDPGALIYTGAEWTTPAGGGSAGWKDIAVSVAFTGPIYIGFWQGTGSPPCHYSYDGTGAGFYKSAGATYASTGPCVDPWPAGSDTPTSTQKVAVYVDYTPSSDAFIGPKVLGQAVNRAATW